MRKARNLKKSLCTIAPVLAFSLIVIWEFRSAGSGYVSTSPTIAGITGFGVCFAVSSFADLSKLTSLKRALYVFAVLALGYFINDMISLSTELTFFQETSMSIGGSGIIDNNLTFPLSASIAYTISVLATWLFMKGTSHLHNTHNLAKNSVRV